MTTKIITMFHALAAYSIVKGGTETKAINGAWQKRYEVAQFALDAQNILDEMAAKLDDQRVDHARQLDCMKAENAKLREYVSAIQRIAGICVEVNRLLPRPEAQYIIGYVDADGDKHYVTKRGMYYPLYSPDSSQACKVNYDDALRYCMTNVARFMVPA